MSTIRGRPKKSVQKGQTHAMHTRTPILQGINQCVTRVWEEGVQGEGLSVNRTSPERTPEDSDSGAIDEYKC